jgi:preprotein translocase subunit SecG
MGTYTDSAPARLSRRYDRSLHIEEKLVNAPIIVVMVLHVISAFGLIVFVLLHSGKGTGLSSMLGGMSSAASGTTIIEKNLDRITIGLACAWAVTSVLLMMFYRPA